MRIYKYIEPLVVYFPGHAIVIAESKQEADAMLYEKYKEFGYKLAYWNKLGAEEIQFVNGIVSSEHGYE